MGTVHIGLGERAHRLACDDQFEITSGFILANARPACRGEAGTDNSEPVVLVWEDRGPYIPRVRKSASHLLVMLLVTAGVFVVGAAQKAPCVSDSFLDAEEPGPLPGYTDLVALIRTEQLEHGRVPMLDPCRTSIAPCG